MTNNRWQMHRAGILNYWYYDEAEFLFADGRLLLRGNNGSGKSVTMQSLITMLLDGVKSPDRLDSFGSRSRRIEDYLLGEKEISNYDERTGYLFLEYKREETDQYMTTGIGLHARRGSGRVDSWGFVITDGRRINKDFYLYKIEKNPESGEKQRIPLSKRELENKIGLGGRLTISQKEYMQMVNRYIFGFKDVEKYQELMRLLIQLRSPKLSRDFKPSVVYEILNASLPSLSDDELRPLSETIESMEKTKLSIEQLEREKKSFTHICQSYDAYNRAALAQKSLLAKEYDQRAAFLNRKIKNSEEQKNIAETAIKEAIKQQRNLELERNSLQLENEDLRNNKIYKAAASKKEKEEALKSHKEKYKKQEEGLQNKRRREFELIEELGCYQEKGDEIIIAAEKLLQNMGDFAATADFAIHDIMADKFLLMNTNNELHFAAWYREWQNYRDILQRLRKMAQQYQRLEEDNRLLEQELGEENKLLDEHQRQQKKILCDLDKERDKLVKTYYEWQSKYKNILPFDQESESVLVNALQNLYDTTKWREVADVLENIYSGQVQSINTKIGITDAKLKLAEEKEQVIQEELKILQETQEATLPLNEDQQKARDYLSADGIAHAVFYEAVEFRDIVTVAEQERIESALIDAGVLNALILANDDNMQLPESMCGTILCSKEAPLFSSTLFEYLKPSAGLQINEERIAAILSSIIVDGKFYHFSDEGSISINKENGAYAYANATGCSAKRESALYIGRQARKAYRKKQIGEKQQELQEIDKVIENLYGVLSELKNNIDIMRLAKQEFPAEQEIFAVYRKSEDIQSNINRQQQRINEKDEKKKQVIIALRRLQQETTKIRGTSRLAFNAELYEQALDELAEYNTCLSELRLLQKDYDNISYNQSRTKADIERAKTETDEMNGELLELDMEIKKLSNRIGIISEYLREMDADRIESRINAVMERLDQIPLEVNEQVAKLTRNQGIIERTNIEIIKRRKEYKFCQSLCTNSRRLLKQEIERGLVFDDLPDEKRLKEVEARWKKEGSLSLNELAIKLSKQYFQEQGMLAEYQMQFKEIESEIDDMPSIDDQELQSSLTRDWQNLQEKSYRQIIIMETGGGSLSNPYQQLAEIRQHLSEQENLLSAQDKKLYEEIIMNNIGRVISQRIYAAEHWIGQMNELMHKSDTSSGLKFHLDWKALKGEKDDELDTGELVELLHMDPVLLKDEDMKKIVRHFAIRIEQAKEEAILQEKDIAFFQTAIRDLLDYRQWFNFKLFYDKGEQIKRRELTDKIFFQFSGGEKAMAMYVPLFSAAYSHYLEAGSEAPFVITLDEAFAGVDEKNIRDMFSLVESLHFNYIMNSQAIWGDYDVVPSLNIYELLRPANAPYVSTVHYHWDGEVRKVIIGDSNKMEIDDNAG